MKRLNGKNISLPFTFLLVETRCLASQELPNLSKIAIKWADTKTRGIASLQNITFGGNLKGNGFAETIEDKFGYTGGFYRYFNQGRKGPLQRCLCNAYQGESYFRPIGSKVLFEYL